MQAAESKLLDTRGTLYEHLFARSILQPSAVSCCIPVNGEGYLCHPAVSQSAATLAMLCIPSTYDTSLRSAEAYGCQNKGSGQASCLLSGCPTSAKVIRRTAKPSCVRRSLLWKHDKMTSMLYFRILQLAIWALKALCS